MPTENSPDANPSFTKRTLGVMGSVANGSRLILFAVNVHIGGGRALLDALLSSVKVATYRSKVWVDARIGKIDDSSKNFSVSYIRPRIISRLHAEWRLMRDARRGDTVLCMGNLPPLFKINAKVFLYIHSRYIVGKCNLKGFPILTKLRILLERIWFRYLHANVDCFIVQTPTMENLVRGVIKSKKTIVTLPFNGGPSSYSRRSNRLLSERRTFDFVYVASGEPHKNHENLIRAWCLLANEGMYPSLCLTISEKEWPKLCQWLEDLRGKYSLKITNFGFLARKDALLLYSRSDALIFPSKLESLGLPLLEARQHGLRVLASELDYVRDVLDPEESFDPDSSISIARAVKRFMGMNDRELPLVSADDFLSRLIHAETKH